ncbi:MAG: YvcK family protein [Clostridia bacterium]|nr:YvcK family protein [Clostridia bacterium]
MRTILEWLKPGARVKRYIFMQILSIGLFIFCIVSLMSTYDLSIKMLVAYIALTTISIFGIIFSFILAQKNILFISLKNISKKNKSVRVKKLLYGDPELKKGPKIVVIGGGSGLPNLLKGLKEYTSNITAVVNVSSDDYTITSAMSGVEKLTPGDIRKCISALSTSETDIGKLLTYQSREDKINNNYSIGNAILTALIEITGSFPKAIDKLSEIFNMQGRIYPVTTDELILCAGLEDGEVVVGKENISDRVKETRSPIKQIFLKDGSVKTLPDVIEAIKNANVIVLGPGSLYTSVASNFLLEDVSKAIIKSKAKKVYIANIMNQPGQTDGYTLARYINEIERYIGKHILDYAIVNNGEITAEMIKDFNQEDSTPVKIDLENIQNRAISVVQEDLVLTAKNALIHDSERLAEIIMAITKSKKIGDLNIVKIKKKHLKNEKHINGKNKILNGMKNKQIKSEKKSSKPKAKKVSSNKEIKISAKSDATIDKIKKKISKE